MSGGILHDPSRSLFLRRRQPLNLFNAEKVFLIGALCSLSLSALAQSADTLAAREIARIDREYSDLSVAKGMPAASVEYVAGDELPLSSARWQVESVEDGGTRSVQGTEKLVRVLRCRLL